MTRISNRAAREYRSELRVQQANDTRARILDATVRVTARGIATVSIPAVAREAGVSVPTVYRHFGTKEELLAAVYPHVLRQASAHEPPFPRSLDELKDGVRAYADLIDSFDDLTRAAMASPASAETRALSMPRRLGMLSDLVDSIEPHVAAADRERLIRLMAVLLNSSALRMWRDHLGASVDQAADDIDWIVRAVVAASRRKKP
ncbi:MAG TPA: helix-turn-helix domain-containing protein [Candidatus Limnocylindria bacterium]|jgi:AcrR family transcriptional regulator